MNDSATSLICFLLSALSSTLIISFFLTKKKKNACLTVPMSTLLFSLSSIYWEPKFDTFIIDFYIHPWLLSLLCIFYTYVWNFRLLGSHSTFLSCPPFYLNYFSIIQLQVLLWLFFNLPLLAIIPFWDSSHGSRTVFLELFIKVSRSPGHLSDSEAQGALFWPS